MPVRSRGSLLAAMAALLGLCMAGAGCQSSSVQQDAFSMPCNCGGGPGPAATLAAPGLGLRSPAPRRSLFDRFRRAPQDSEPALACAACAAPAAVMLRPVPGRAGPEGAAVASSWHPVLRGTPEEGPDLGTGGTAGLVKVSALGSSDSTPFPLPIATADKARDAAAPPPPGGEAPLHAPRLVPRPAGAVGPVVGGPIPVGDGYPALPAPFVTHPPEAPREFAKRALSAYVIEPPDILLVQATASVVKRTQQIEGPHLVRPDGTIGLGVYGSVFVAGRTLEEARDAIARLLKQTVTGLTLEDIKKGLTVDVVAYNSKFYYVITDGGGYGEQVIRVPATGNETVLDALSQIQGLPTVASKKRIWIARATPYDHEHPHILPVDWRGITQRGSAATNYQIFPGDRIYVDSAKLIKMDSFLAKFLSPIERVLGVTLLGSQTVNSIKSGTTGGVGTVR